MEETDEAENNNKYVICVGDDEICTVTGIDKTKLVAEILRLNRGFFSKNFEDPSVSIKDLN
jgi:hypothetical protein